MHRHTPTQRDDKNKWTVEGHSESVNIEHGPPQPLGNNTFTLRVHQYVDRRRRTTL